jgi:hypothetical protein
MLYQYDLRPWSHHHSLCNTEQCHNEHLNDHDHSKTERSHTKSLLLQISIVFHSNWPDLSLISNVFSSNTLVLLFNLLF